MPLQHIDHATGETLLSAQVTAYDLPVVADQDLEKHFKSVSLGHTQDRLSANKRQAAAMAHFERSGGRGRRRLDLPCDIHLCASVAGKV